MGLKGLKSFNNALIRAVEKNKKMAVIIQKKVAMDTLRGVVLKTPVVFGRAMGNWQIGIGESPDEVLSRTDKSGGATIADGMNKMASLPFGISIYITNNVEYILYLEEGTPKMKAVKMLALTLEEVKPA